MEKFRGNQPNGFNGLGLGPKNKIPSKIPSLNIYYEIYKRLPEESVMIHLILGSVYNVYKVPSEIPALNTESITLKPSQDEYNCIITTSRDFRAFLNSNPVIKNIRTEMNDYILKRSWAFKVSAKAGPNGKAQATLYEDAFVLRNSSIWPRFEKICKHLHAEHIINSVNLYSVQNPTMDVDGLKLARLTQVPDRGNKNRVVAIQNI